MSVTTSTSNTKAPSQFLRGRNETYAYRRFGSGPARPLLFLQHFTGTLDNWDPAVTDPLASGQSTTGHVCWTIATDDAANLEMFFGSGNLDFPGSTWFALH